MTDTAFPLPIDETKIPLVKRFAAQLGRPIVFFDLETTTNRASAPNFGIAEVAYIAVTPEGEVRSWSSLMNPEHPMEPKASQITGLTDAELGQHKSFTHHARRLSVLLEKGICWGFNSHSFDVPGLLGQLERYGHEIPTGRQSGDLRDAWRKISGGQSGTLTDVCSRYEVTLDGAHRAPADTLACLHIMEQMLWEHGSKLFTDLIKLDHRPGQTVSGAPSGAGTGEQGVKLKGLIDEALAQSMDFTQLKTHCAAQGVVINMSPYGASYMVDGVKVKGSELGTGYGWGELGPKFPGAQASARPGRAPGAEGAAPRSSGSRTEDNAKASEAILAIAQEGQPITTQTVSERWGSGANASAISFAISELLSKGQIRPEQVAVPEAQGWLSGNIKQLQEASKDGKLKPMMEQAKALGAPASVDYVQLRVALASAQSGARVYQSPASAPARAPSAPSRPTSPPAAPSAPAQDIPPFDEPYGGPSGPNF